MPTLILTKRNQPMKFARSSFPSSRPAPFTALKAVVGTSLNYCWKLVADEVGQWRVSVVVLGVNPLARKVQHSPSVEQ